MGNISLIHWLVFIFVFGLTVVPVFFLPTIVASWRRHPRRWWIAAINLLLGWTGFGWAVALVWSLMPGERRD
jgi:hypothetical protein